MRRRGSLIVGGRVALRVALTQRSAAGRPGLVARAALARPGLARGDWIRSAFRPRRILFGARIQALTFTARARDGRRQPRQRADCASQRERRNRARTDTLAPPSGDARRGLIREVARDW